MRPCPYCGKDIQDEAIVCRYCGLDVDRPEWLRNKVRCPYCAEWISPGQDLCPFCKSELEDEREAETGPVLEELPPAPEEQEPSPSPTFHEELEALRASTTPEPPEPEPEPEPEPVSEPEPEAPFRPAPPATSGVQEPYFDPDLIDEQADEPLRAHPVQERGRFDFDLTIPAWLTGPAMARFLRTALLGVLGAGAIGGAIFLLIRFGDELPTAALSPAATTVAPTVPPTEVPTDTVEPTEEGEETAAPAGDCLSWEEVTLEDAGQELCVFGTVKRWFAAGNLPFVAIFTEEAGTFALVDRTRAHPGVRPGQCIRGVGEVEIMSATRPFIDLDGEVLSCPEDS